MAPATNTVEGRERPPAEVCEGGGSGPERRGHLLSRLDPLGESSGLWASGGPTGGGGALSPRRSSRGVHGGTGVVGGVWREKFERRGRAGRDGGKGTVGWRGR